MSAASNTHGKNSHRSRTASAFLFPDTADYLEPSNHPSTAPSPRLQVLSGTGSPCGSWISLSARELLEDDYSEIDYSDMDGEDDMIYDSPPYYHDEEERLQHQYQLQQQQQQHHHSQYQHHNQQQQYSSYQQNVHPQGRPLVFAGKGGYANLPASSSSSSSHHSSQEQEQAEEALRASLSTLLSSGPRPRFRQRRNRPRKIYTVDTRSQRSSPLVPASPTHLYYSSSSSPHLRPSNPESILGDLSPHYFHGSITPNSRDYDSASSDSEAGRQKKVYHRGILSTGQPMREHYYDIESTTLNSSDPAPFSGSTTPLNSPHHSKSNTPPDSVTNKVLQGPSSLLATRYVSWSVKAQSILDHAAKEPNLKSGDGHSSSLSSRSSSPHSSPSSSGASTPSRTRRRRCPIPEPHQGFFSRALDQRSLASHVSVSRVGMAGTMCPPLHVGLRTGILIRGSSPLRPVGANQPSCDAQNSSARSYSFKNMSGGSGGVLTNKGGNNCDVDIDDRNHHGAGSGADDKENKRWYSQELGLNLWQTTLGAAALLGTGFGSGMVKKVHSNSVQLHAKELVQDKENIA
ncbi:hypothetical protein BGX29_005543 [Mortierella sp. GBA35]|nr:hypothetical protein BGX29_005543 [Mortierella sp. GBA35]